MLLRDVYDVVPEGAGNSAKRRINKFAFDGRTGGTTVVDGGACSEERKATSSRTC
jgi:hypothetical protein